MKRGGELKRTAFARTKPMRRKPRSTSYSRRERFSSYMLAVKLFPCAAAHLGTCEGVIEADHAGRRGIKQKAHDSTVIPLCTKHHRERDAFVGDFRGFDHDSMRAWLLERIADAQAMAIARGIEVPKIEIPRAVARYTGPRW